MVVYDRGEVIGHQLVCAADDKIAGMGGDIKMHSAVGSIFNDLWLRTDSQSERAGESPCWQAIATGAWILPAADLLAGTTAGETATAALYLVNGLVVARVAVLLPGHLAVRFEAESMEFGDNLPVGARHGSRHIGIVDP